MQSLSSGAATAPGIRCAHCRAAFDDADWQSLELAERLQADQLQSLVLRWPSDQCIEVRCCRSCGKPISARRSARPTNRT